YEHIHNKYQCHIRKKLTSTTDNMELFDNTGDNYSLKFNQQQLEIEWSHLNDTMLDKLYCSYNLLNHISLILKNMNENDLSQTYLYDFINNENLSDLHKQLKEYEIKDFQLCYIDHVREL
ncbi:unnamed protein product, partial [Didymodactylos carnosus]